MSTKISGRIVGYDVKKPGQPEAPAGDTVAPGGTDASGRPLADVIHMHETLERPQKLVGSTYKLKTPDHVSAHAMYITVNDIVLNEGTEHELRRPFEIFINSKNLEHYQWIVALTLIMSAVFRKGGDVTFLVDELRSVFDPRGGYWNKGKYVPSIIAEIGDVIEHHLVDIGMLKRAEPDAQARAMIDAKKAELAGGAAEAVVAAGEACAEGETNPGGPAEPWMAAATMCPKCNHKAVVLREGCQTCMSCGDSKCG